jgi:DNA repair exonuclease SbcCD nuclease subunit
MLVPDVHASKTPPSSCTDSYEDDLFALLAEAATFAVHCEAVIFAGDLFHLKPPVRTPHRLILRMMDAIQAFGIPAWIVPGNHDMLNDRIESIMEGQPLGVLIRSGILRLLQGWMTFPDSMSGPPVYGVPWLQHWTDEAVSAVLAGYRKADIPGLVVTHAPLYPPGQELKWEHYPAQKWADAQVQGSVFYGHVHEPHGEYQVLNSAGTAAVDFCNYGALSRGSLHEYNRTRQVGVTIWDSETGNFEFVPLHAKPAEEVFRLEAIEEAQDRQQNSSEFLAGIASAQLEVVSTEAILAHLAAQDAWGPPEQSLAEELLADAAG